jgi:dihydrofolate reductase
MNKIIIGEFLTLDGVVDDPDGTWGAAHGGWALRHGPQVFGGDKLRLADVLATGALLLGRGTWQMFAGRWPQRDGAFADAMNAARKYVASTTITDVSAWSNSSLLEGDLTDAVERIRRDGDVAVIGSPGLAQQLAAADMVDEYRLFVLPTVAGAGMRLFGDGPPAHLEMMTADAVGEGVLLQYRVLR